MANVPIMSFNAGELSPLIDARSDTEKYSSGCRHLDNFIPRIYGAAERRPGTKYVISQYNSANSSIRLIPFIYSTTTSYLLEFGNLYIRYSDPVYYNGIPVTYEGETVTYVDDVVTSPYLEEDLFQLQYNQVGDVMWIVHPNYAPRKLTRTSDAVFSLDVIIFDKGPFALRNDLVYPDINNTAEMVSSVTDVGDVGTLTIQSGYTLTINEAPSPYDFQVGSVITEHVTLVSATILTKVSSLIYTITKPIGNGFAATGYGMNDSSLYGNAISDSANVVVSSTGIDFFQAGHIGALFQLVHPKGIIAITGSLQGTDTGYIGGSLGVELAGDYTFKVSGNNHGTTVLQKSNDGFATHTDVKTYTNANGTYKSNEPEEDWFYRINVTTHTSVTITASLSANTNTVSGKKTGSTTGVIGIPMYIKGTYTVTTKGNWDATFVLERNENGAGWEPFKTYNSKIVSGAGTGNFQYSGVEDADNVQYRMNVPIHASGTIYGELTSNENIQTGVVRVTSIISPSVAAIVVITKVGSTEPTRRWSEGVWSSVQGYPTSVTFFEGRCIYGGMTNVPTQVTSTYVYNAYLPKELKVWFSYVEDYENFEAGVKDADSFELVVTTTDDIMWLESLESLVLGTSGDEWRIGSNKMEQPISPTNFSARQQSTYGSRDIQAVRVNDQILFVDFVGRKVRELTYTGDKYVAPDLTVYAEHITMSGIVEIAIQKNPDSILWCVLDDGSLVTMTYERDQKVVAWAKMPIDGIVQSVAVLPGEYEDEVWIVVQRTPGEIVANYEWKGLGDGQHIDGTWWTGMAFTPEESFSVTSCSIKIWKTGSPKDVTVGIVAMMKVGNYWYPASGDNYGLATYLTSGTITESLITSTSYPGDWCTVTFSSPVLLQTGATYGILVKAPSGNYPGNTIWWPTSGGINIGGNGVYGGFGTQVGDTGYWTQYQRWGAVATSTSYPYSLIGTIIHINIEKFAPRNFGTLIDDAYFVDCGVTYEGPTTSTLDGLDFLEGKTVKILSSGVVFDDAVVTSGQITTKLAGVTTNITKAQIGLPYISKLQPMRLVYSTKDGHSQGMITRVPRLSISFVNTMSVQYGASDNSLFDINWTDPLWENSADSITGLFTGEVTVSMDGGFSVMNPVIISTDQPLPCIVRSIMPRLEVTGD